MSTEAPKSISTRKLIRELIPKLRPGKAEKKNNKADAQKR